MARDGQPHVDRGIQIHRRTADERPRNALGGTVGGECVSLPNEAQPDWRCDRRAACLHTGATSLRSPLKHGTCPADTNMKA